MGEGAGKRGVLVWRSAGNGGLHTFPTRRSSERARQESVSVKNDRLGMRPQPSFERTSVGLEDGKGSLTIRLDPGIQGTGQVIGSLAVFGVGGCSGCSGCGGCGEAGGSGQEGATVHVMSLS